MKTIAIFILAFCMNTVLLKNINAANYTWTGSTSTAWNNSGNWNPSGIPDSTDNVTIVSTTNQPILDQNRKVNNLTMTSGSVDLNGYELLVKGTGTFTSGTITNGNLKARGILADFKGTMMDCTVDAICGYIKLSGSQFEEDAWFEDTGYATGTGDGGNTFNGNVTIKHTGSGTYFHLATTSGDVFNGNLTLINTSTHEIHVGRNDTTNFNGNIEVNNTSTGGITFGNNGGISYLVSGKTITIGSTGFTSDILLLKNFYQSGSTSQTLTLTGSATANLISSTFDGALTITAPLFLIKDNTFNGATTLTKNGSSNGHSDGGNTFHSSATINNTGSGGRIRLSTTTADNYNGPVEFLSSGQAVQIAYTGNNLFKSNISINHSSVVFNAGTGTVVLGGNSLQEINGSVNYSLKNLKIDQTILPNQHSRDVYLGTTMSIDGTFTLTSGNLVTDTTNLLTMKAGSSVSGASNNSFVSGPVKKIGNTAFVFPVGKGGYYRPASISAPAFVTDAFLAEYFKSGQQSGENLDSILAFLDDCNHWKIDRKHGGSNVNLSLTWQSDYCPIADTTSLRIVSWHAYHWDDTGHGTITGNYSSGSMATISAISDFGLFAFAYDTSIIKPFDPTEYPIGDGFVTNIGQLLGADSMPHSEILYYGTANNTNLYLSDSVFSYVFMSGDSVFSVDSSYKYFQIDSLYRIDMKMKGINSVYEIIPGDTSQGYKNYFLGYLDTSFVHALTYQQIKYNNIYNGINLKFHNNDQRIFELDSSGLISSINMYYQGADSVTLSGDSILSIYTNFGIKKYAIKGFAFTDARWNEFEVGFQKNDSIISYSFGSVTKNVPLLLWIIPWNLPFPPLPINPQHLIKWSTSYTALASPFNDNFADVHIDADDNIYVTGFTSNPLWPYHVGPFANGSLGNNYDATVVKFKSTRAREFATFYGGSNNDRGIAISVDNNDKIVFAGVTGSANFPSCVPCVTPYPTRNGVNQDVFLVKLDANGQTIRLSTYFGSSGVDYLSGLTIDNSNDIYISGGCGAALPTFTNPANSFFSNFTANNLGSFSSSQDGFIAKFSSSNNLLWRTHIGSDGVLSAVANEYVASLDVDASGNLYALGSTHCDGVQTYASPCTTLSSTNFPIVGSNYIHDTPGEIDYFILKFNSDLQVTWSTLFGGSKDDKIDLYKGTRALAVSPLNGDVFITGATESDVVDGFDIEPLSGAYNDNTYSGIYSDGFIAKFDSNNDLNWCTYYGGSSVEQFNCVTINDLGQFIVSGFTFSDDIDILRSNQGAFYQPLINNLIVNNGNSDGFIAKFSSSSVLNHATYLGGTNFEDVTASSLQPNGYNWISVGVTGSSNFNWYDILHTTVDYSTNTPPSFSNGDNIPFVFNLYNVTTPLRIQHISDNHETNVLHDYNHKIFPNPFSDVVNISLLKKLDLVRVYDNAGKELQCYYSIEELNFKIDLSNYSSGIYFLEFISGTSIDRYKVIKTTTP